MRSVAFRRGDNLSNIDEYGGHIGIGKHVKAHFSYFAIKQGQRIKQLVMNGVGKFLAVIGVVEVIMLW